MNIFDFILKHEGLRLKPYKDTQGLLHIGIGRCIELNGISKDEAIFLATNDINGATKDLSDCFPWFKDLSDNRQMALIDMCFQLGILKLLEFKEFITSMSIGNFEQAATDAMDSLWAKQAPYRAKEVTEMIRNG